MNFDTSQSNADEREVVGLIRRQSPTATDIGDTPEHTPPPEADAPTTGSRRLEGRSQQTFDNHLGTLNTGAGRSNAPDLSSQAPTQGPAPPSRSSSMRGVPLAASSPAGQPELRNPTERAAAVYSSLTGIQTQISGLRDSLEHGLRGVAAATTTITQHLTEGISSARELVVNVGRVADSHLAMAEAQRATNGHLTELVDLLREANKKGLAPSHTVRREKSRDWDSHSRSSSRSGSRSPTRSPARYKFGTVDLQEQDGHDDRSMRSVSPSVLPVGSPGGRQPEKGPGSDSGQSQAATQVSDDAEIPSLLRRIQNADGTPMVANSKDHKVFLMPCGHWDEKNYRANLTFIRTEINNRAPASNTMPPVYKLFCKRKRHATYLELVFNDPVVPPSNWTSDARHFAFKWNELFSDSICAAYHADFPEEMLGPDVSQ